MERRRYENEVRTRKFEPEDAKWKKYCPWGSNNGVVLVYLRSHNSQLCSFRLLWRASIRLARKESGYLCVQVHIFAIAFHLSVAVRVRGSCRSIVIGDVRPSANLSRLLVQKPS